MSNWNQHKYATSGIESAVVDITRTFTGYLVSKFPYGTFKPGSVYIDTLGYLDDHKRREKGLVNPQKVNKPHLSVGIEGGNNDIWSKDNNGPDINQYSMFPGVIDDKRIVSNHRLAMICNDRIGIRSDTIEFRRKTELTMKFMFDTKADLSSFKSHLYNNVPVKANQYLEGINYDIVLPNIFIRDLYKLFMDQETKSDMMLHIDEFLTKVNSCSGFIIEKKFEDVNPDNIWFVMKRSGRINFYIDEVGAKDGDGANKRNESYDEFSFSLKVTFDLKLPNSYIMNYKIYNGVNKSMVCRDYFNQMEPDAKTNVPVTYSAPRFVDDRVYKKRPSSHKYIIFGFEEFFVENPDEVLQLTQVINPLSIFYLLFEWLTPKERKGLLECHVYENGDIMGGKDQIMEDVISDIVLFLKGCDPTVSFVSYFFIDYKRFRSLLPLIVDRIINNVRPNWPYVIGSYPPRQDPDQIVPDYTKIDKDKIKNPFIRDIINRNEDFIKHKGNGTDPTKVCLTVKGVHICYTYDEYIKKIISDEIIKDVVYYNEKDLGLINNINSGITVYRSRG